MRKLLPILTIALAIVVLPSIAMAEEAKKEKKEGPPRRDPAQLFQRLDANHDGQLTLDEVPEPMKERFTHILARADKDGDKKVTLEEFVEAAKQRPDGPPDAGRRERGDRRERGRS